MMPADYKSQSGATVNFDLDAVFDLVNGNSAIRPGWSATIIFVPSTSAFVELRSSPPDYRGGSAEEASEVGEAYIQHTFSLSLKQIADFKAAPESWRFVDRRHA